MERLGPVSIDLMIDLLIKALLLIFLPLVSKRCGTYLPKAGIPSGKSDASGGIGPKNLMFK